MDHLSSSQINLYLLCGLKYRFHYIDKLPKPFRPSALAFGSAFHSALSWLNNERLSGRSGSLEKLHKIFDADWYSQRVEVNIQYKDGEEEMKLGTMGKEMLRLYFQQPHKEVKGSEIPFTVPLVRLETGERLGINLEGYFDLLEADTTIVEYKTSTQALTLNDVKVHLQLTAYGYAFLHLTGNPPKGFRIVNFVKTKKPRLEMTETERGAEHFDGFFALAQEVLNGITKQIFLPRPGYWCKDCEYASECPLWKTKTSVSRVPEKTEVLA